MPKICIFYIYLKKLKTSAKLKHRSKNVKLKPGFTQGEKCVYVTLFAFPQFDIPVFDL